MALGTLCSVATGCRGSRSIKRSNVEPAVFVPVRGGWGLKGATNVRLQGARVASLRVAVAAAWQNVAPRRLVDKGPRKK